MWKKKIIKMLNENDGKNIVLAVDTSTIATRKILIKNIVSFIAEKKPEITFIQADYKIRKVTSLQQDQIIEWYKHGKASYTDVLEWGTENNVDTLFYITDVTGYIYENLKIKYEVIWIVPDDFLPRVPFGKAVCLV